MPKKSKTNPKAIPPPPSGRAILFSLVVPAVVMVIVVVAACVPFGVTVAGEKLHAAPEGSPEQLNVTAELNPFAGVTVNPTVAL